MSILQPPVLFATHPPEASEPWLILGMAVVIYALTLGIMSYRVLRRVAQRRAAANSPVATAGLPDLDACGGRACH